MIEAKTIVVTESDPSGVTRFICDEFSKATGYTENEVLGALDPTLRHPEMPKAILAQMQNSLSHRESWRGFVKCRAKDGSYFWAFMTAFRQNFTLGDGILAVRAYAFEDEIERAEKLYAKLLESERRSQGDSRNSAEKKDK
ncbi:MAG: PAS domain-containing protein [Helicobacteraceae bacterium]|jgi:aerotaxis receptor|nr:PAS domain-containing protein [Helicobacteraceae bacterium]